MGNKLDIEKISVPMSCLEIIKYEIGEEDTDIIYLVICKLDILLNDINYIGNNLKPLQYDGLYTDFKVNLDYINIYGVDKNNIYNLDKFENDYDTGSNYILFLSTEESENIKKYLSNLQNTKITKIGLLYNKSNELNRLNEKDELNEINDIFIYDECIADLNKILIMSKNNLKILIFGETHADADYIYQSPRHHTSIVTKLTNTINEKITILYENNIYDESNFYDKKINAINIDKDIRHNNIINTISDMDFFNEYYDEIGNNFIEDILNYCIGIKKIDIRLSFNKMLNLCKEFDDEYEDNKNTYTDMEYDFELFHDEMKKIQSFFMKLPENMKQKIHKYSADKYLSQVEYTSNLSFLLDFMCLYLTNKKTNSVVIFVGVNHLFHLRDLYEILDYKMEYYAGDNDICPTISKLINYLIF